MFYEFKGGHYLCPRCLVRDYNYYYQKANTLNENLDDVKLQTGNFHPYQDLVTYCKQWCFSCANRIGENDAFEMRKGARICASCVSMNISNMVNMVKCIACEGFIHNSSEVFEVLGS